MDLGRFLIETHLQTGRSTKELAKTHDVSPSWLFTLLRRYRLEGPEGLEPRSRRPKRSPGLELTDIGYTLGSSQSGEETGSDDDECR